VADDVTISLRARGAARAARDVDNVSSSVGRLGRAASLTGRGLGTLGQGTARMAGSGLGFIGDKARYAGVGLLGLGTASGLVGLRFNADMEQNRVAFTNFLGSADAADSKLRELFNLAKVTPFEFRELVSAQTRMMGFGLSAERTTSVLRTLGDAVAGSGGGTEEIKRATYAIGQMAARGKVTQEELNQLAEARIPAQEILRKELGLTKEEMGRVGDEGISSGKAIAALQRGLGKMYGGQAAKQAKTYTGQVSMLRDNFSQLAGTVSKPAFDWLRGEAFPVLNESGAELNKIFARDDIDLGEKLRLSRTSLRKSLGPLSDEVRAELAELNIGGWLSREVDQHGPEVGEAIGKLGWAAAKAFGQAWWDAGPIGKLGLTALAWKMGLAGPVFGALGKGSAWAFRKAWAKRIGRLPAPVAPPVPVPFGGDRKGPGGAPAPVPAGKPGTFGRIGQFAKRNAGKLVKGAGIAVVATTAYDALANPDDAGQTPEAERAYLDAAKRRNREKARNRPRAAAPVRQGQPIVVNSYLTLTPDGKRLIAKSTSKVNADRAARR
jgi:tape measure domain-containing protein